MNLFILALLHFYHFKIAQRLVIELIKNTRKPKILFTYAGCSWLYITYMNLIEHFPLLI